MDWKRLRRLCSKISQKLSSADDASRCVASRHGLRIFASSSDVSVVLSYRTNEQTRTDDAVDAIWRRSIRTKQTSSSVANRVKWLWPPLSLYRILNSRIPSPFVYSNWVGANKETRRRDDPSIEPDDRRSLFCSAKKKKIALSRSVRPAGYPLRSLMSSSPLSIKDLSHSI